MFYRSTKGEVKLRNVLVISLLFGQTEITGVGRLRGLIKYLPEFGWNPVVLTAKSSMLVNKQNNIFETPYEDTIVLWKKRMGLPLNIPFKKYYNFPTNKQKKTLIDKIIYFWFEIFTYPHPTINWSISAIEKGEELLKEKHFDAIISSMSPCTSHIVASHIVTKELVNKKINRKKIPWVADFRDLWTQNHYNIHSSIRGFFEKRLELNTLSSANALTTVSQPLSDKLKELHKNKKVYTITNGYDPEQINPGISVTKKFTISYTGTIYKGRQDPEPLFRVLKVLIDENKIDPAIIEVNFFGYDEGWLISDIKKYQLENIIQIHGKISREESIQKQRESQVLLLLTWNDPKEKGIYTGKIFDYLAARRPILALGLKGSVVTDLLNQTQAGENVTSDAEIKSQILKFYREFNENGFVKYSGILSEIEKYSHREMAKKFAEVLLEICESKNNLNI